jgi:hypothetical protein
MARRRRRQARTSEAAAPAAPMTEVQHAAARMRRRAARHGNLADLDAGTPPPEQLAKNLYRTVKIKDPLAPEARLVKRNFTGRTIDLWRARGMISERQYRAAERYRDDWERAGFTRSLVSNYEMTSTGGGAGTHTPAMPGTLAQMDAWRRFNAARVVLSRSLVAAFDAIVLDDLAATEAVDALGEQFRNAGSGYASRFVPLYVRAGGDDLADYYRLPDGGA